MTELYVKGVAVSLPEDFELTVRSENPRFSKNGAFSLDLTLSLDERNNALLFGHMNRMHSYVHINGWRCRLVCDGRLLLNGTVAFVSNTERDITIQLLSGNSELNFFVRDGKMVSELDMGTVWVSGEEGKCFILPQVFLQRFLSTLQRW